VGGSVYLTPRGMWKPGGTMKKRGGLSLFPPSEGKGLHPAARKGKNRKRKRGALVNKVRVDCWIPSWSTIWKKGRVRLANGLAARKKKKIRVLAAILEEKEVKKKRGGK